MDGEVNVVCFVFVVNTGHRTGDGPNAEDIAVVKVNVPYAITNQADIIGISPCSDGLASRLFTPSTRNR